MLRVLLVAGNETTRRMQDIASDAGYDRLRHIADRLRARLADAVRVGYGRGRATTAAPTVRRVDATRRTG